MKSRKTILTSIALIATCLTLSGCYERVVRADGLGAASRYDIYEPSTSDTFLDRAFDSLVGTKPKPRRR